ncbi:MAG TPA: DUF4347 domain-containing protein [Pseudomonas sp.]|uniref:DUF4347 domain-containing protein n=1 Tax=Pseudomonas sp. TaxID=306 RepID=UPI002EDBAE75
MTTDRTSSPFSANASRGLQRRKPAPLVLEARIMFDGAAVATAAEAVKPIAVEAPVAHVAELGSVVAASQTQSRSTAPVETSKATTAEPAKAVAAERATDGLADSATKVLFVDSRVPDYQSIIAAAAADVKVVLLDADRDGVQQIADALEGMHDVESISIVSHGDSGLLLLGNSALYSGDMAQYQAQLGKIGSAMQADGEILLYGCDVGAGTTGQSFIQSLADATGAVVAASTDSTGNIAHGGNWDLEIATGTLNSAPVLDVSKLADYDYSLYTTSVSNLAQLKAAIATADTDNLDDTITLIGVDSDYKFASASDAISINVTDGHKLTIVGTGHTLDADNWARVISVGAGTAGSRVELQGLTIKNGLASGNGGDTLITGGAVGSAALGGGIYNAGVLTITNSIVTANKAAAGGGGGSSGASYNYGSGGAGGGGGGYGNRVGGKGGDWHPLSPNTPQVAPSASGALGTAGQGGWGGAFYSDNFRGKGGSSGTGAASGGRAGQVYNYDSGGSFAYVDSGGNGGVAGSGALSISGGGGGSGYTGAGGRGGDAAGGIYNSGILTIINSTVSNNIAAGGGGGGGSLFAIANAGKGGDGGNAAGGIYNIGTLRMDTTSTGNMTGNVGAGGKGGKGSPGNGTDGTSSSDRTATGTVVTDYVAPTLSGTSAGLAVNDNASVSPFTGLVLSGSSLSMTITLDSAAKGSFTSASLLANGFSSADGGLTYTHAATTAATLGTAVHGLVYQPMTNRVAVGSTETTTFSIAISDGAQTITNNTTTVVATSINDAPTGMGNTSIPTILEDATSPVGVAISALTGINFSDPDPSASLGGIAVSGNTANSSTQGVWQYSADAGAHWYAVGTVSTGSSLLLSASSQLRFLPAGNYNGTPPALTVRAVDNTRSGYTTSAATEVRVTADASTNGGSTAFAATTNTIATSVTAVNDVPTFTKGSDQTVLEDAGAQTVAGWATGIGAGASNESGQSLNFIVSNSNNALFSNQPSIDASGNLVFTPVANANGTATVTLAIHDNGGTGNGGVDTSATQTFTITFTPVNDAPTGLPTLSGSSTEGQALTANTSGIADVEGLVGVTFNHQWQVSADGVSGWTDISGATASTYTLASAQVNKYVRDQVSFTDEGGTLETLASAASSAVIGIVPLVDSIERVGAAAVSGSASEVVYTVKFNVPVSGVDINDFELNTTGTATGHIFAVISNGASDTWQVIVSGLSGDGTLRLDLHNSGTGIVSGTSTAIGAGYAAGQAYILDHTPALITNVSVPNTPLKAGDTATVTITVGNDGGDPYTLASSTIGGYTLSNLTRVNSTTYTSQFTVTQGGTDVAASSDVPLNIVLADSAGNRNAAYITPISQSLDSINANAPTGINLSNASVRISEGPNATVGTLSTTDASIGDSFTYSLVSGAGSTDNASFSLVGDTLKVVDSAALGEGDYSVRIRTTDSGGNAIDHVFSISVSSYVEPVAANDTASATEAGGVANGTAGANPTGNVLNNDQSSNTKTVTAIAGGTVGAARAGTYGNLTLNANGSYTYTVNNANAAVQALRTNADTLTDTFTYTLADNTAATSSATLTVTIHGANDAPQVATALPPQQVTVSTPLLYTVPVGTFSDVDTGDTLTYSATLAGGAPLPAWLTFNSVTRTFSGTPTTVENLSVVVTTTDLSAASASNTFTLEVTGVVPLVDSIERVGAAAVSGSASEVVYTVKFNVPVSGVDINDFVLSTTGTATGNILAVSSSGASDTWQVIVSGLSGDGTLRLDLNNAGTGIVSGTSTAIGAGYTAGQTYTLDHTPALVTNVSVPNAPLKAGDTATVTITVGDDGGSPLTLDSGSVAGYALSNLTRINSTTYTAQFTVPSGGTDVDAGDDLAVNLVFADQVANRNTAYTTPISQSGDGINVNVPTAVSLSNASVRISEGPNATVGTLSTTDASIGDSFTYSFVPGAGSTDNASFSLVGNTLKVIDPAALGEGDYSVRIRTTDSGGNAIDHVFSISVSSYVEPVAANDTASATEAGGVANGTAGANPTGNVLTNDLSSNTKTVTAIAGGTVGSARAGAYGSLTLNADGSYTYTVDNANAAVQALSANTGNLTDSFTYTLADNTLATSSATLTITVHGANDAPIAVTAIPAQQATVSTPLLYVVPVDTFSDVDAGDTLTYTATLAEGAPLPAWLSFNGATRTFSGTPTTAQNLSVVVTATDLSAASVSNTFTLEVASAPIDPVTPPVTPPVQTPDPQVPNKPQPPITATAQTSFQPISETVNSMEIQADWSANRMIRPGVEAPGTGPFISAAHRSGVNGTGVFSSLSGFLGHSGPLNEHYSALSPTPFNDFQRTQTDSGPGIFSVGILPLGQSGLTVLRGMGDQQFALGEHLLFTLPADAFGHSDPQPGIVLKATQADGSALPTWLTFNSTTGLFEGTPPPGFKGELAIKVVAKDSSGHQAEVTFRVKTVSEKTTADIPRGRSGLSEQLRTAASRTALWASGRT